MKDSYLSYREAPAAGANEAHRYDQALDLHGERRQSADWAGGGPVSSTRDLARYLFALVYGELFAHTIGRAGTVGPR